MIIFTNMHKDVHHHALIHAGKWPLPLLRWNGKQLSSTWGNIAHSSVCHACKYVQCIHSQSPSWMSDSLLVHFPNQFHHSVAGEHCMESKVEERDFWLHFSLLSWMQVYMDYESPSISYSISSLIQPLVSSFLVFCISPSHACIQVYFIARCSMFFTYA